MPSTAAPAADLPWAGRFRGTRRLRVIRTAAITPRLRRITLGGEEMAGFGDGPNLKLMVPQRAGLLLQLPAEGPDHRAIWPEGEHRPAVRTYSIRRHDAAAAEIDVDFVLHGDGGAASAWAARARPDDEAGVAAPGGRTVRPAPWTLLAGDHTALPGIARILEAMPGDARGTALIEVPDPAEEQDLCRPAGIDLRWLHRGGAAAGTATLLEDAVLALPRPPEGAFAWIGTESAAARRLRAHVRDVWILDRRRILAIGYWKRGMSETDYGARHDHDRDEDFHRTEREERVAAAGAG